MNKYIIGLIGFILIAAAGYYFFVMRGSVPAVSNTPQVQGVATSTYATSTFSVVYQQDYTVDANYVYDQVNPKKPIHGVQFVIPLTMATGTNLSSETYVSIEQLPRAKNCTGDIYLAANVHPQEVSDNGVTYSLASSTGAAAGNMYEETVYALSGSSPCTAVRYFIHSGNIGNYPPGAVQEFDHSALLAAFDTIRRSLQLVQ